MVEYFVKTQGYENEGHVITRKPNVLDFWQRQLEFLAPHLDLFGAMLTLQHKVLDKANDMG